MGVRTTPLRRMISGQAEKIETDSREEIRTRNRHQAQHPEQYHEHYLERPEAFVTKSQASMYRFIVLQRVQFCLLLLVLCNIK